VEYVVSLDPEVVASRLRRHARVPAEVLRASWWWSAPAASQAQMKHSVVLMDGRSRGHGKARTQGAGTLVDRKIGLMEAGAS
jgi:hypothetical protein